MTREMLCQVGEADTAEDAGANSIHVFSAYQMIVVKPFAGCILASADKIETVKSGCIDHVPFDPDAVTLKMSRESGADVDCAVIGHLRNGRCRAQCNDCTQSWAASDLWAQDNDQPVLDHFRWPEALSKVTHQQRAGGRVLCDGHEC